MKNIAFVTTFPDNSWDVYSKKMLEAFVQFMPPTMPIMVQLDDDLLYPQVDKILRECDGIAVGWEKDHAEFVERNKDKDHPTNYRKQAVKFCHKVFAIKRALDAAMKQRETDINSAPRYLIWIDADVIINRSVSLDDINACLPKEGDAVSYMGRKDWDHSECGWLAFDLEKDGDKLIDRVHKIYLMDKLFDFEQWHDSFIWDKVFQNVGEPKNKLTNLTVDKPGMDIWQHSPMAKFSHHYKGNSKQRLAGNQVQQQPQAGKISIIRKNSIPNEQIQANIIRNKELIKQWVRPCAPLSDSITVVSAGPQLVPEDIPVGGKIVAVKHALEPLKKAGIKPWACILLDPRPHVANFVEDADKDIIWFVASQVNPAVTERLIELGCNIWGYHAAVGAGEEELIKEQFGAIISGGSATATRGLYLLHHLGFSNFELYGYDLCLFDKPDLNQIDDQGQCKFVELSVGMQNYLVTLKRMFWTTPELIAQYQEVEEIIHNKLFNLNAYGDGMVPYLIKLNRVLELRKNQFKAKMLGENPLNIDELINGK